MSTTAYTALPPAPPATGAAAPTSPPQPPALTQQSVGGGGGGGAGGGPGNSPHQQTRSVVSGAHLANAGGGGGTPAAIAYGGGSGAAHSGAHLAAFEDGNQSSGSGDAGGSGHGGDGQNQDERQQGGGKAPSRVTARRAQQNREAQRNFRERRKNYIKELETKVQNLISKDSILQKTEQQCRDFQMIVDRLSAERDVWVRERELWWREREEIYRAVEALRMEVRQSQTENRRLREMAWTLWNDVGGRNSAAANPTEGEAGVEAGAEKSGAKKAVAESGADNAAAGDEKAADAGEACKDAMEGVATASGDETTSGLPSTPFSGDLSLLAAGLGQRQGTPATGGRAGGASSNGPVSPTDIAHDLLALSRAGSPTSRAAAAAAGANGHGDAGVTSGNAIEDLKTRMSFWDAERENLYRAASDRERELLLSSLMPSAPAAAAAAMNMPPGGNLNAVNAAQLFARMAAGLWGNENGTTPPQQPQQQSSSQHTSQQSPQPPTSTSAGAGAAGGASQQTQQSQTQPPTQQLPTQPQTGAAAEKKDVGPSVPFFMGPTAGGGTNNATTSA
ncbi:hypothetical protein HDU87_000308 [Geranomyces variabilis]|uniref:BZIP domain-containing protein n=1 Tax=Geranomyces variabilis TaxID=109894 RepID=A0AAD5TNB9_9FUNG|nr:hypothetical protein HDU87_000308 [Geranomyces variabilis]